MSDYVAFIEGKALQKTAYGFAATGINQSDVIERAIELWSNPGDLVFSPFTGVGSEGVCAVGMGRKFVGAELKKNYFDVARRNLREATRGQTAGLFDEAA
jgi:DNA modification methylase